MISFITNLDLQILHFLYAHRTMNAVFAFIDISELGDIITVVGLTAALCVFLAYKKHFAAAAGLLISVGGSGVIALILKHFVHRLRPDVFFRAYPETGFSLPSGHATASVAFYGFLIYLAVRYVRSRAARIISIALCSLIILVVGFSRLYLGVHYTSDVILGWVLGGAFVWIGIVATRWLGNRFLL